METKNKGIRKLLRSFEYAFSGLAEMVKSEQNARIHIIISVCVIIAGFLFKIAAGEWCIALLCIALVWAAEAFNTAIEGLTDHLFKEKHETAKKVKDISAAAVLLCAIISVLCGVMIFLPKLLNFLFP